MKELYGIIGELGLLLHPDRIDTIAGKIGALPSAEGFAGIKGSFGPNTDKALIDGLDRAWRKSFGISPKEVAAALRGAKAASELHEARGALEMVWTGPSTGLVPVRHTKRVLCEVIDAAKHRLFIVSFVAYDVTSIVDALRGAIGRGVQIGALLELSESHGGRVGHDSIATMRKLFPAMDMYVWRSGKGTLSGAPTGAVHAKCAVADQEVAFITSANLTGAAMERNMELGVLIKGGNIPSELHRHLEALVSTKVVEKID